MTLKIGIIDADLCSRTRHRFPNLASMKISGHHKELGDDVILITDINPDKFLNHNIVNFKKLYDKIYISKVFVDTNVPYKLLNMDMVMYGGSGFFGSDSEYLPSIIESHMPDYHLYDDWIIEQKANGSPDKEFRYYELYSLGYTTRGCVRQCSFCINKHCTKVEKASPIKEFFNVDKRNLCLLDDNVLAYENWREIFEELNTLNKMYEFKQGLDIRMLTEEKAKVLVESNLNINGLYFAFDNINEKSIIEEKLTLWRKYYRKHTSMYVLCGYDENTIYNEEFWAKDIENTLERIKICMKYNVFPYIMRYKNYKSAPSPYYGMYITLASWCNQKGTIARYSFTDWANKMQESDEKINGKTKLYSAKRYLYQYAGKYPDIAYTYFDLHYENIGEYKYVRDNNSSGVEKPFNKPKTKRKIKVIVNTIAGKQDRYKKTVEVENIINIPIEKESLDVVTEDVIKKVILKIPDFILEEPITEDAFKDSNEKFLNFNTGGINIIPINKVDLLLLNCKDDLGEHEKSVISLSEIVMTKDANLIVNSMNLKSFNLVREYIEKNTSLIFNEVTTFTTMSKNKKVIKYCSKYNLVKSDKNMFYFNDVVSNKVELLKNIITKITVKDNIIVNFFDRSEPLQSLGETYKLRNWIYFSKRNNKTSQYALNMINEIVGNRNKKIETNKINDKVTKNDVVLSTENEQTFLDYYSKEDKKGLL